MRVYDPFDAHAENQVERNAVLMFLVFHHGDDVARQRPVRVRDHRTCTNHDGRLRLWHRNGRGVRCLIAGAVPGSTRSRKVHRRRLVIGHGQQRSQGSARANRFGSSVGCVKRIET